MSKYEIIKGVAIIPDNATEIESQAFAGCKSLQSVVIPESAEMGINVFYDCTSLQHNI